ncbi:MAG: chemotaxis protein CheA, partial [Spirochaetota bacterium]|nr:chemotaxis protein CheA [Spirochaetota bacterium]
YPTGEFILASPHETQELRNKLYLSDVTKELKFQEFKRDMDAPADKVPEPAVKKEEPTVQAPVAEPAVAESEPVPVAAVQAGESKAPDVAKPAPQKAAPDETEKKHQVASVLRVESSRIDEMLNLVGELVIIKASFIQLNDNSSTVLDELNNSLNQYRVMMRQLVNDVESHFEGLNGGNGNGKKGPNLLSGGISQDGGEQVMSKDFLKQKLEALSSHFDTVIPDSKSIQDKLKSSSQSLGRITDDLQESVMKVRMVPINQIFSRFPRLVRDISRNLHKNINLVMEGEDTELDKSVIEDLVDPLIHIVRNAVDHAIETPAERQKAGKDPAGTILLKAGHEGNTVTITVKDDGQGINMERVRQKAIENKLIDPNQELSEKEIIKLIFEPGFSTAKEVTSLSGRGVGMDVVRKKIENIGGDVDIETKMGQGSTFLIKIPLTLAIIQALLVQVGEYVYSIPINSVIETLRIGPEEVEVLENTEVIRVRDEVLSLVHLDHLFKHSSKREDEFFYVIVVGSSGKKVGLGVDNLIGEQDVVIKPLNNKYTNVPGIAGATILGDGQVSLVLDVISLLSLISSQRKQLLALH